MIPIYKPYFTPESQEFAHNAIKSGWISSIGEYKELATEELKKRLSIRHVLLTANGTLATFLLLKALKFKFPNITKLVIPNNVYVAPWNVIFYENFGYELIILDSDLETWNADYTKLDFETNINNIAFFIVHNYGNIINVIKLKSKYPNAVFIEDNCEGIFGKYEKYNSGTISFCSALSFYGNKNITCGEGGAFLTNDDETYHYISRLMNQGQTKTKFLHDLIGYNFRMTNVHAALLLGQLKIYDEIYNLKKLIYFKYQNLISDIDGVYSQKVDKDCQHSYWMFCVRIIGNTSYEDAEKFFLINEIELRPMFFPITKHLQFSNLNCDTFNAELLNKECIVLPSYPELTDNELFKIIEVLKLYVNKLKNNKNEL